jgi:hypothetical protein
MLRGEGGRGEGEGGDEGRRGETRPSLACSWKVEKMEKMEKMGEVLKVGFRLRL